MLLALSSGVQIAGLFAAGAAGYAIAERLHLPVPGNVLAIALLYLLLATRIVRLSWLERGASLVTSHLVLFIIPLAAGLMTFGNVIVHHGMPLLLALGVSL